MFELDGKHAIVCGGTRGLGKAIAFALGQAGASVAICSRNLEQAQTEARNIGRKSEGFQCDLTRSSEVDSVVNQVIKHFGRIDILICNAATNLFGPALEMSDESWKKVLDTELSGYFYMARAVGHQMVKQKGGSIIMVSGNSSEIGYHDLTGLATAKGGVDMLVRNLAVEWGQFNIRVNSINPGYTEHLPEDGADLNFAEDNDTESEVRKLTPLQRRGSVDEIAAPVVFLASEAASFITGVNLRIDGGYAVM